MATERLPKGLLLRGDTYHLRFTVKGVMVAESTHTKNLREAERILNKRRAEMHTDVVLLDRRVTNLHAAIDTFCTSRATPAAQRNAERSLKMFKTLPDMPLKRLEPHQVDSLFARMRTNYALSTVAMATTYWNTFCKWCEQNKYAAPKPIKRIRNVEGRTRWLTPEEQVRLLAELDPAKPYPKKCRAMDALKQTNYDLTVMLLDTGLRYTEGADLHWNSVDFERRCIYVRRGKSGTPTTLSMTARLQAVLVRRRSAATGEYVFDDKAGRQNRASVWMKAAAKRAGISSAQGEISPHILRHTFASTMIQNGISLTELQYLLGHSTIEMTQRYSHFRKQDATDKAAEIMNRIAQQTTPVTTNVVQFK